MADDKILKKRGPQMPPAPSRVVISGVEPAIETGRFPIKRVEGEPVTVTARIFADGHDLLSARLRHHRQDEDEWIEIPMRELGNDRWTGQFTAGPPGFYEYTIKAWVDKFKSWRRDLRKKVEAGQDVALELRAGAEMLDAAGARAEAAGARVDGRKFREWAQILRGSGQDAARQGDVAPGAAIQLALSDEVAVAVDGFPDARFAAVYEPLLGLVTDRVKARFSAWYEMFPRSASAEPGRHSTFKDCEARLPYVSAMGFDVLYLPPIHPIGRTHRKGRNNNPVASAGDVGSPWAIGAEEGGHKSVHPELGTLEDFRVFAAEARRHGLEIALDLAYQSSPDHPYVKTHPEWYLERPDGSIQYAENPPKKYEDIYPFNFESDHWEALWEELKSIVLFWIEQGVRIFRVDNPHTKPFAFWEWLIRDIKGEYPEVIFHAEAFTRPEVMQRLAKLGFSQSYTYFAWRNTKWELTEYLTELTQTEMREYFRPNLWPNTPDILTEYLQLGGKPAFITRLLLAATLGASYGIYGPAFELCENQPLAQGMEEYLNAEKYEIRHWELSSPVSLKDLIARVNHARRENPALESNVNLRFHKLENDQLIAYSKSTDDRSNVVLVIVNLDTRYTQSGWVEIPLEELGVNPAVPFQVHDLLTDTRYLWQGPRNYVQLDPHAIPGHVFRIRHRVRREHDFDYYM